MVCHGVDIVVHVQHLDGKEDRGVKKFMYPPLRCMVAKENVEFKGRVR